MENNNNNNFMQSFGIIHKSDGERWGWDGERGAQRRFQRWLKIRDEAKENFWTLEKAENAPRLLWLMKKTKQNMRKVFTFPTRIGVKWGLIYYVKIRWWYVAAIV